MKTVPLTRGHVALVDDEDFPLVSKHKWHVYKNRAGNFYAYSGTGVPMHRFLLSDVDTTFDIDHKNGNGLDNRRRNLRVATRSENLSNSRLHSNSTTGFKGVSEERRTPPLTKPYRAYININGVRTNLGYFPTLEEAAKARDAAAIESHGEFARTNEMLRRTA